MFDIMQKGIQYGLDLKADFIDIRYQNKYNAQYQSQDGELTVNSGSRRGFCTRILINGSLGFASTTSMNLPDLKKIIYQATKMARGAENSITDKIKMAPVKAYKDKTISPRIKAIDNVSLEEKIFMIKEAEKEFKNFEYIKSYTLGYDEIIDHRIVVNNEGAQIEQMTMIPTIRALAVAAKEGKIAPYQEAWSKAKGFELLEEHSLLELAKFASKKALQNVETTLPPGGLTNVVVDHTSVGIIAHEAIGHTAEMDLVDAGSFVKGKLGKKVCSELITLIDTPFLDDAAGWLPYDDEGTKGKTVEIIKNGIFTGYLNDRAYAGKSNLEPTGNARAFNFDDEPLIRMRNTYIAPGDMSNEELFEAVKDGLFLTGMMNGSADTSGEFMVGIGQAIKIKNGELTDEYYIGPTVTGNAFEVLSSTFGVGKNLKLNIGTGFCGKNQPAKVDAGGGLLACKVMLGGR